MSGNGISWGMNSKAMLQAFVLVLIVLALAGCGDDVCSVVCKPFAPSAQATWGGTETVEAFEFVGTLRVDTQGSEVELILEDIDLQASRRLADGEWGPIPTGDFTYVFP
jgi:hypothetical protein